VFNATFNNISVIPWRWSKNLSDTDYYTYKIYTNIYILHFVYYNQDQDKASAIT